MGQRESHHGVLRETRPIPWTQQMAIEKNENFYLWLYAALGFGGGVFLLILIGMWCQSRGKSSDSSLTSNDSFLHVVDDKRDSSILDGSLTTSSVQPMSNFDKMSEYPPPSFCSSVIQSGKGMSFGSYNLHHQQPHAPLIAPTPQMQNDALLQTLNERPADVGSSRGSLSHTISLQGRQDSFPYEEYGMAESERTPLRTRVEDQSPFNSYLHLTPTELNHLDSLTDMDSVDLQESRNQTLPIANIINPK